MANHVLLVLVRLASPLSSRIGACTSANYRETDQSLNNDGVQKTGGMFAAPTCIPA